MRDIPLTVLRGGINRLRTKGGARSDSLYDLHNGYLTTEGTARNRPGTLRHALLPQTTRGLCSLGGQLHVFSHQVEVVPDGYVNHVLVHPDTVPENIRTLHKIHFAKPFLGFLYVAAEFDDGAVYHFWLQSDGMWQPNTVYQIGDVIEPSTPNGLAYRAVRLSAANPAWAARTPRAIGDKIEPTVPNGFYYEVVDVIGDNPASGDTEPTWPTQEGAQITEDTEGVPSGTASPAPGPGTTPTSGVVNRYGFFDIDLSRVQL